ncbi:MAG TPA: patatin-like phospholipase family protein [Thermoanaerobaculia bacterium]|nr:patatin-like phospholipase family protein [Thermoanaerobaculia bacterium]
MERSGNGSPENGSPKNSSSKIGLALATGAPEGAIYEIGALRALDEALEGINLNEMYMYVGVSAGAFLCANLANDLTTAQMCRAIVSHEPGEHPFIPETFFTPDWKSYLRGGARVPRLLVEALWDWARHLGDHSLVESLMRLSRALPVGLFDNEPIRTYLQKIYNIKGRTDDFRKLGKRLVVVATDLDSGKAARFGEPGLDHVPISKAVQASGALPGLYSAVEIDGRHYVDGVLLKTLHASVALEAGAELVICVNPIVPVDTIRAVEAGIMKKTNLRDWGLPTVLSQTFRTIVHSRLEVGMASYETKFRGADIVRVQPRQDDYLMFFTNIFGFSARQAVCEYAYQATRRDLLERYDELAPIFARHGVTLRRDVLEEKRNLWDQVKLDRQQAKAAASTHATVRQLDDVLSRIERMLDEKNEAPPMVPALLPSLEESATVN